MEVLCNNTRTSNGIPSDKKHKNKNELQTTIQNLTAALYTGVKTSSVSATKTSRKIKQTNITIVTLEQLLQTRQHSPVPDYSTIHAPVAVLWKSNLLELSFNPWIHCRIESCPFYDDITNWMAWPPKDDCLLVCSRNLSTYTITYSKCPRVINQTQESHKLPLCAITTASPKQYFYHSLSKSKSRIITKWHTFAWKFSSIRPSNNASGRLEIPNHLLNSQRVCQNCMLINTFGVEQQQVSLFPSLHFLIAEMRHKCRFETNLLFKVCIADLVLFHDNATVIYLVNQHLHFNPFTPRLEKYIIPTF